VQDMAAPATPKIFSPVLVYFLVTCFGFGSGRSTQQRPNRPTPGSDLRYDLQISFMEAVHGVNREITITKPETCWTCDGTGLRPGYRSQTCSMCNGHGQVTRAQGFFRINSTCPQCQGSGEIISDPCQDCGGQGLVNKKKKVALKIPAGVDTGARMRLTGEGEGGRKGGAAGNLYVIIHVEPHEFFEREGQNIYCTLPISMVKAALGAKIDVPTIHGKRSIAIKNGSQSGQSITVRGEGVPSLRGQGPGGYDNKFAGYDPHRSIRRAEKFIDKICRTQRRKRRSSGGRWLFQKAVEPFIVSKHALNHFDAAGNAWMVDVSAKDDTAREAVARGSIRMTPVGYDLVRAGGMAKRRCLGRSSYRRDNGRQKGGSAYSSGAPVKYQQGGNRL